MRSNKWHLGKILRYMPLGTRLYSPCYGDVTLGKVDDYESKLKRTPMITCFSRSRNEKKFFMDGSISTNGECMLFPTSEHRDWEHWQEYLIKPGTVIVKESDDENGPAQTVLYTGFKNISSFAGVDNKGNEVEAPLIFSRYATRSESIEFLNELIENGYEWNETEQRVVKTYENLMKFDISTLKPFDKVLFIPYDTSIGWWRPGIVSCVREFNVYLINQSNPTKKVIPYEGNEHLIGETEKEEDFYIKK